MLRRLLYIRRLSLVSLPPSHPPSQSRTSSYPTPIPHPDVVCGYMDVHMKLNTLFLFTYAYQWLEAFRSARSILGAEYKASSTVYWFIGKLKFLSLSAHGFLFTSITFLHFARLIVVISLIYNHLKLRQSNALRRVGVNRACCYFITADAVINHISMIIRDDLSQVKSTVPLYNLVIENQKQNTDDVEPV